MATFDLKWLDDNGNERDNKVIVQDNKGQINLHPKVRVRGSKYSLDRRHKFLSYVVQNTEWGNVRGYFEGLYLDNENPKSEITELKQEYNLNLSNKIRTEGDWTKEEISASAVNKMAQYLFDSKPIFKQTAGKPNIPLEFVHPVLMDVEVDTETNDVTVIPRSGTLPFQVKLDNEGWQDVVDRTFVFPSVASGEHTICLRDGSSPKVRSLDKTITL